MQQGARRVRIAAKAVVRTHRAAFLPADASKPSRRRVCALHARSSAYHQRLFPSCRSRHNRSPHGKRHRASPEDLCTATALSRAQGPARDPDRAGCPTPGLLLTGPSRDLGRDYAKDPQRSAGGGLRGIDLQPRSGHRLTPRMTVARRDDGSDPIQGKGPYVRGPVAKKPPVRTHA
jgi:hypothetical protein